MCCVREGREGDYREKRQDTYRISNRRKKERARSKETRSQNVRAFPQKVRLGREKSAPYPLLLNTHREWSNMITEYAALLDLEKLSPTCQKSKRS